MPKPRVAITLGDPCGIGPEIVSKALRDPHVRRACEPIIVGDPLAFALHHEALPTVQMLSVPGLSRRARLGKPSKGAGRSAIDSLQAALGLLRLRQVQALVTAPVSKESFHAAALGFPGHTEWLAQQAGIKEVGMLMLSGPIRALLMTRHVPLIKVAETLTVQTVCASAKLGHAFVRRFLRIARPRLALCGINPHAGDNGLIGHEEKKLYAPALAQLRRRSLPVAGPFSADVVFAAMKESRFDLALAAYHDQGMIAAKVFGAERLVNLTLGLPYVRTSPGHGTAYDIAGRRKADPRPMIESILLAARYAPFA